MKKRLKLETQKHNHDTDTFLICLQMSRKGLLKESLNTPMLNSLTMSLNQFWWGIMA